MAFQFRLAKVLRYRRRLVDQRARDVALAAAEARTWQEHRDGLAAQIVRERETGGTGAGATLDATWLTRRTAWLAHLERLRRAANAALAQAEEELAARRAELTAAWRDVEVLERLSQRQHEAWRQEERRREVRELDEIGGQQRDRARRSKVSG